MDPNANITRQCELAQQIIDEQDIELPEIDVEVMQNQAIELAELALALDEWRRKGGFDPYRTDSCTGYISETGHLTHDGDTCPVHEV